MVALPTKHVGMAGFSSRIFATSCVCVNAEPVLSMFVNTFVMRDWTPVSGIFVPNLGALRALLLFFEKPPTIGRNNQNLHMIKLRDVPQHVKRVVEIPLGECERG